MLTIVTFAQYGIIWTFLMLRDASRLAGNKVRLAGHVTGFSVVYGVYLVGSIAVIPWNAETPEELQRGDDLSNWFLPLALGLTIYWAWLLIRIARMLRAVRGSPQPATGKVILLSLLWATSLPYLQSRLNVELDALKGQSR